MYTIKEISIAKLTEKEYINFICNEEYLNYKKNIKLHLYFDGFDYIIGKNIKDAFHKYNIYMGYDTIDTSFFKKIDENELVNLDIDDKGFVKKTAKEWCREFYYDWYIGKNFLASTEY